MRLKTHKNKTLTMAVSIILVSLTGCTHPSDYFPNGIKSKNGFLKLTGRTLVKHAYDSSRLEMDSIALSNGNILILQGRIQNKKLDLKKLKSIPVKFEPLEIKDTHFITDYNELYNPKTGQSNFLPLLPCWHAINLKPSILCLHEKSNLDKKASCITGGSYNPKNNTITQIKNYSFREKYTTLHLSDGRILLIGGYDSQSFTRNGAYFFSSVVAYDPNTNTYSKIGQLKTLRTDASAIQLSKSEILILGGEGGFSEKGKDIVNNLPNIGIPDLNKVEVFNLETGKSRIAGETLRWYPIQAKLFKLSDNKLVIIDKGQGVEIWDIEKGKNIAVNSLDKSSRYRNAFLLPDGRFLIIEHKEVKLYDPKTNQSKVIDELIVPRRDYTAVMTLDNKIWIIGGIEYNLPRKSSLLHQDNELDSIEMLDYNEIKKRGI